MSENLSPDQFGELAELIYDRKLIAAIKLLREWTFFKNMAVILFGSSFYKQIMNVC